MAGGHRLLTSRDGVWCTAHPTWAVSHRREDPSPSFLSDLQGILAGRALLPTSHHSAPAPQDSTLRLKACTSPPDVPVAQPPRRGRSPAVTAEQSPPPTAPPRDISPQRAQRRRRVTFKCPVVTPPPSPPVQHFHPSGRPARSAGPPRRYLVSRILLRSPRLGGELWRDDIK